MQAAYSVSAVRDAERAHANELASGALMARAAWALASVCIDVLRDRGCRLPGAPVVLLVGAGNNGGDALFAGALLARRGLRVSAVAVADTVHEAGRAALLARGGRVVSWSVDVNQARALLAAAELVVDGITGLSGRPGLTGPAAAAAAELTEIGRAHV